MTTSTSTSLPPLPLPLPLYPQAVLASVSSDLIPCVCVFACVWIGDGWLDGLVLIWVPSSHGLVCSGCAFPLSLVVWSSNHMCLLCLVFVFWVWLGQGWLDIWALVLAHWSCGLVWVWHSPLTGWVDLQSYESIMPCVFCVWVWLWHGWLDIWVWVWVPKFTVGLGFETPLLLVG